MKKSKSNPSILNPKLRNGGLQIQGNQKDNDLILSEMLAHEIKEARKRQNPSADDILLSIGNQRVVFK